MRGLFEYHIYFLFQFIYSSMLQCLRITCRHLRQKPQTPYGKVTAILAVGDDKSSIYGKNGRRLTAALNKNYLTAKSGKIVFQFFF